MHVFNLKGFFIFENNQISFCNKETGNALEIFDVSSFILKNNTFDYISHNIIYLKNSKVILKNGTFSNSYLNGKNLAGLFYILSSLVKISDISVFNFANAITKPLIMGFNSEIIMDSSIFDNFTLSLNPVNFYFKYAKITILHSYLRNFNKGLLYIENSLLRVSNSTFVNDNSKNVTINSNKDIFSIFKIVNTWCQIISNKFIRNRNIFSEAGVFRFF